MPLFKVPERALGSNDATIIKAAKTSKKTTTTVKGGGGLAGSIALIKSTVEKYLGKYADETILIRDEDTLNNYIDKCIENGIVAIDTETTGLDPMLDKLVGVGFYTYNSKTTYAPVNHRSYITKERSANQLDEHQIGKAIQRLKDAKTKVVMFNAPFDIRVLGNQTGVYLDCFWDCYLGARLLNENERAEGNGSGLKALHKKYVLDGKEDAFKYDDLFKGICFADVPIDTGYLYGAHDPKITLELYDFQRKYLSPDQEDKSLVAIYDAFRTIEEPIVPVVVAMEDTGIELDQNKAKELSEKYHKIAEEKLSYAYKCLEEYKDKIETYRKTVNKVRLDNPINISSTEQLKVLLYDIIGVGVVDKKDPQGTGKNVLSQLDIPLASAILEYREVTKLLNTYIDKLPSCVNPNTGRIHCKFNSYGADTGRFSSDSPNLQNIPAKNHDIRQMFKASSGEELIPEIDNHFEVDMWCEVKSQNGWISAHKVSIGDRLEVDDATMITVTKIDKLIDKNHILLYYI